MQSAKTYNIPFRFSLIFVAAVRKDIRPEETFTLISPTLNKHNHCSPQRHTILLWDYLLCSWPQSAKTYDLQKHVLSDLLHLTNTIIAVRKTYNIPCRFSLVFVVAIHKDIQPEETFTLISPTLNKHNHCNPQRHTIFLVRKDIQYSFSIFSCLRARKPQRHTTWRNIYLLLFPTLNKHNHCSPQRGTILLLNFLLSSWPLSAKTYDLKKHLLSDLLHLTNTIIAVRKDIQYSFSIFSRLRGRSPQRHTTWRNIYSHISYT